MISICDFFIKNKYFKALVKFVLPKSAFNFIGRKMNVNRDVRIVFGNHKMVIGHKGNNVEGLLPVFYWDGEANFGDMIGPYLVSKITGKPVLNVLDSNKAGFMTVGSILQMIDRRNITVWGSGLIEHPTNGVINRIKNYEPQILSVRGKKTAKYLEEAGMKILNRDALGDPALIMPLFYTPKSNKEQRRIAICPHYIHKSYFLSHFAEQEELRFIDVQKDLEYVVDEISSSAVCVSTSLHGLIISQAYGVPWVWLEIIDQNLKGDDFKFKDFFSTLKHSQIAHVRISLQELADLDIQAIAAKAFLPEKQYKEELILGVLKERLVSLGEL